MPELLIDNQKASAKKCTVVLGRAIAAGNAALASTPAVS